ncbi:MAG: sigma-70 family RNA polymerase sigma factor [Phycisphaerales bacterium]|nr:sigma-70 family RNA polymerase sigma factor [Phycisphaerales bacterium]
MITRDSGVVGEGLLEPTVDGPAQVKRPATPSNDLAAVYDRLASGMYRFVMVRVGRDEHLAKDIMQQLWAAAARNGRSVPEAEMEFWLRGVARNLINTHWRRVSNRPLHLPVPDQGLAGELADRLCNERLGPNDLSRREVQDQLALAITQLTSDDQDLIHAHYVEGQTQVQIAERDGLSVRAVEGRLYRARAALREQLRHLT